MSARQTRFIVSRRLVVRSPNWLGDAVMVTPALLRLRQRMPDAEIWVLGPEKLADLFAGHPAITGFQGIVLGSSVWQVARELRAKNFDAALVLPNSHRTALEAFFAGVPERAGLSSPGRSFFLTRPILPSRSFVPMRKLSAAEVTTRIQQAPEHREIPAGAHHVHQYLYLAAAAFDSEVAAVPPMLAIEADECSRAASAFKIDPRRLMVAMHPGAQYGPAKRWPQESFIAAAKLVAARTNAQWIILGSAQEKSACEVIARTLNADAPGSALNLAGSTSLRELMALLKLSNVLLTNDSGPMHVAAALGTRVVAVFGSTSPELTGPPKEIATVLSAGVPCAPCFLRECPIDSRCLRLIHPELVAKAILTAIDQKPVP